MRANRLSPARIARAVSAILLLSLLQVVVPPVLAPQLTTPIASAADANNLPSGLGTVYQFLADSYTTGSTTWPEARGGTGATISSSALKVTNTAGTLGANKSVVAVQGSYLTSITFPAAVAYGNATNPNDYTFFHVARYAPQQISPTNLTNANYCDTAGNHITNNAAKKNRIFSSTANNWLSGFWACSAGVAFHYGWLTQSSSAVSELTGNSGNNWLLSADCGYVSSSTSACKGRYRAFGTDRTISPSTSVVGHSVVVNGGQFPEEVSDFQIAEVISYPTILAVADIVKVETYLARKYGITLSSTAATKLGIHRASVGTTLNEPLSVQPQVAIQDSNGQTVTTDNSTIITATVTGLSGRIIGTATADAVQGVATFDNLGLDGIPGNSYTLTYTSNAGLATTSESRVFTRGGGSETDTALSFNGANQYAAVPSDGVGSIYDFGAAWTTQAWIKPGANCVAGYCNIIGKEHSFLISTIGNKLIFCTGNGTGWTIIWREAGGFIPTGAWSHIAATYTGTTLTIYLNGRPIHVSNSVAAVGNNNEKFAIGARTGGTYGDGSGERFQGEIDEVRVWNSARSQANIESDMHSRPTLSDSNLKAYFDFNEGSGSTLFNRVTYSLAETDLTLAGSPSWLDVKEVSTSGAYTVVKFPRSYIVDGGGWKAPRSVRSSILAVAGGGGGGSRHGGGGGGGGVSYAPTYLLSSGATYEIKVGAGGFGYGQPGNNPYVDGSNVPITYAGGNANGSGTSGGNSTFKPSNIVESMQTALGGGGGGGVGVSGTSSRRLERFLEQWRRVDSPPRTQFRCILCQNRGEVTYSGHECG
jgi:hypothetical protein